MIAQFRFFDMEAWSIFATLQTIIILFIFSLGMKIYNLKILVLASLIAMMQGKFLPRIIFAFFLSLIVWNKNEFVMGTILTIIAAAITALVPYNNPVHKLFLENRILKMGTYLSIVLWFILIIYLTSKNLK